MMNRLITPRQVVDLAFGEAEYLSEQAVSDADIVAATSRYVVPIVGEELAERLAEGEYSELLNEYVAPALAAAVRYMIQPLISLRTGDSGLVAPKGDVCTRWKSATTVATALSRSTTPRFTTICFAWVSVSIASVRTITTIPFP